MKYQKHLCMVNRRMKTMRLYEYYHVIAIAFSNRHKILLIKIVRCLADVLIWKLNSE